jgi:hypothetical protein
VLEKVGLLNPGGTPHDNYVELMKTGTGPGVLGEALQAAASWRAHLKF